MSVYIPLSKPFKILPLRNDRNGHVQKKVAQRDIAKTDQSQIFVLFENETSYEDFFLPTSVLSHVTNTLCNIFSQNLI